MSEDNVAEQKEVDVATQTSPPQVEAPPTEEQTNQVNTDSQVTDELPVDVEEQRRAFQEQRLEIKRLREEKEARAKSESAFDVFRPKAVPQTQSGPIRVEDYTDPYTGVLDTNRYNEAVNNKLQFAEQNARFTAQQTVQETLDENKAKDKYPELFADPETEQEIADRWFAARMRGENPSVFDIAGRVAKRFGTAVSKAEKIGAEKILEQVSPKEQAALAAEGGTSFTSRNQLSNDEFETLRRQSRGRDSSAEDAVAKRLKRIPYQE
jgi:hypothetical protein